jgi:conjugative relaxase-like TrwC/TraI family protein
MFNMTKIRASGGGGKSFYANHLSSNDYYSEHERVDGHWKGELAEAFGLKDGVVSGEEFSLFQRNVNPLTMDKLTQRNASGGPRFFDFQCAAPKSVSVMSMFDDRLLAAHVDSVRVAMRELERLAAVRVRDGENVRTNNYDTTGKLIYAEFTHDTSRALDPQLHTHNVVCNVTRDSDGKYKALESLEMVRAIRFAGKVYHNAMASKCRELGYETVKTRDQKGNVIWFDLKCVPEDVMERFSKRRHEIEKAEEKFIAEHGRKPTLSENNYLSMSTRSDKMQTSTADAVREYQMGQLSHREEEQFESTVRHAKQHGSRFVPLDREQTAEQVKNAAALLYERDSVLKLDKILAEVLNRNLGTIDLAVLRDAVQDVSELRNLSGNEANPYYAPEVVIERELTAIRAVEEQRDIFDGIAPDFKAFPGDAMRAKQAELIHGLLSSKDRFNLFRGVAGAGKTSTLQEFCRGLCSGGVENIHLIAPTNSATDVLRLEGFEKSQTVASFLLAREKPPAGSYVIIDESGLNSLREGVEIMKLARANNYRVLFVGDARQHTAVESGDFFRLLEDYSQIRKFSLTDIHRQQHEEYRRGIFECAMGQYEQAFERFDGQNFIHEGKRDYLKQAAQSYMEFTENGQFIDRAILVAPTHDECDRLTDSVRTRLKNADAIAKTGHTVEVFRSWNKPKAWLKDAANFQPGMTVGFVRNFKGIGSAGETAKIQSVDSGMLLLENGKRIYARAASDFIEVGELHKVELCKGDLIQFRVNLKDQKIYNGSLARITDQPGVVELLFPDGKPREMVEMPKNYAAFDYGWVATSHKSQGRTAENVVVAAESLDRKAFYVALSRGRQQMALHCPDKNFLKEQLMFRSNQRASVHDLIRDRAIPAQAILPLSDDARQKKSDTMPDLRYKDVVACAKEALRRIAGNVRNLLSRSDEVQRLRQYRVKIFDENTRLDVKEHAVGLLSKAVKLFQRKEAPPVAPEPTPEQIEAEFSLKQERAERWKVFEAAWSRYIDDRKEYHDQYGGGGERKQGMQEIMYRDGQSYCQFHGEEPMSLPDWMVDWRGEAEQDARYSRDALVHRLETEKREKLKARWDKANDAWSGHVAAREAYHERKRMKFEFKLWPEEIVFEQDQFQRWRTSQEPEPIPAELQDWHGRADDENHRMSELLRQQQEAMLRRMWADANHRWQKYLDERQEYQEEHYPDTPYELSQEELDYQNYSNALWETDLPPEIPDWIDNWREQAEAERLAAMRQQEKQLRQEYEWEKAWEGFDARWERFQAENLQDREPSFRESSLLKIQEQRRSEHKLPMAAPSWMLTEEELAEQIRNNEIARIKENLGIDPDDADLPLDSPRRQRYEDRMQVAQERIAKYDEKLLEDKLSEWMAERKPTFDLKLKIQDALYRKHGYTSGAENAATSAFGRHGILERKKMAEKEYAEYQESLKPKPVQWATPEQIKELNMFVKAEYIESYPADLTKDRAEVMLRDLWAEEREVRRQNELEERRERELEVERRKKSRSRGMDL